MTLISAVLHWQTSLYLSDEQPNLLHSPLGLHMKCSFLRGTYFLQRHMGTALPLRPWKPWSFAASCVVKRHLQTTAGGNRANASPAVPPVGLLLLSCDGKCWLHFLWLQTCLEESSVPVQTCCRGIGLPLPPLSCHGPRRGGRTKGDGRAQEGGEDLFCLQELQTVGVMNSWIL